MENEAFVKMDSANESVSQPSTPALSKKKWSVKVKDASMELSELSKHTNHNYNKNDSFLYLAVQSGDTSLTQESLNSLDNEGFSALHHTTRYNRIDAIKVLLKNGADVDIRSRDDHNTPLHIASRFGWLEASKLLLENGADPTAQNINGSTPLHLACRRNKSEIITILLDQPNVDVDARDKLMDTPLKLAASQGCPSVCELLIDRGADVLAEAADHTTPLYTAIANGNSKCEMFGSRVAKSMLSAKVGESPQMLKRLIESRDMEGNTLLHVAALANTLEIAERLVELGADVNEKNSTLGKTPLHMACAMGSLEMAKKLIKMKAKIQPTDFNGQTPLHKAAMFGHVHIINYLLDNGADVDPLDNSNQTPFLVAVASSRTNTNSVKTLITRGAKTDACDAYMKNCFHLAIENQNIEVIELLLEDEAAMRNLSTPEIQERVPLHYAALCDNIKALRALLTKQSHLNHQDEDHNTPLYLAAKNDHAEHVEALGLAGASVNERDDEGKTALHAAASNGSRKVCKTLIKLGADVNSRDNTKQTPLMYAAVNGCAKTCKTFLDNNANIDDTNNEGETALLVAIRKNNGPVVELLLDRGADASHQNFSGQGVFQVAAVWNALDSVKAMCHNKRWRELLEARKSLSSCGRPMYLLISSFPEAATIIMNKCINKSTNMHPQLPDYTIEYDFEILDPGPDDPAFIKGNRFFGPLTMVKFQRRELLLHPLTQALLDRKWHSFGSFIFYFSFTSYLIFLLCYSHFIITERMATKLTGNDYNATSDFSILFNVKGSKYYMALFILIFVVLQIGREIVQILIQRQTYFTDAVNLMEWTLYGTATTFLAPYVAPDIAVDFIFGSINDPFVMWIIAVFSIFLCYINLVLFLRRFNLLGIYISMFVEVLRSVVKVMFVFLELIVAFSIVFFILFKEQDSFESIVRSFLKTTVMFVGEIDFSASFVESIGGNNGSSKNAYPEIAFFFCFLFLFAMSISLMNLLVGLAVGDIDSVRRNAELKRLARQVEFVSQIEEKYPKFITRMVYKPRLVVKPNKRTLKKRIAGFWNLWSNTLRNLVNSDEEKPQEEQHTEMNNDFGRHLEKNRRQIKALVAAMETQNKLLTAMANKIDPTLLEKSTGTDRLDFDIPK